ncbi:F0F1 ATP synthase subunit A [Lapillicoccus sp.]|uniref:F0F1 ATP synthase subunit A n=1 Tax=Lapillicoccus sp. TaxID=1909287 RepID=UPI0025D865FF|nr:F0F1 ATP synthase subunit A [Lapillicoccus sp.]
MSPTVLSSLSTHLLSGALPAADGGGGTSFVSPGVSDFFWPLIGGDSNWAFTRPSAVLLISVGILGWFFIAATRKLTVVPGKRQFLVEQVYGFVRNTIAKDVIGTKDFQRFLPLLFTLFTMVLVNNLFGIIPLVQFPTMSRIAFPIVLTLVVYVVYHVVGLKAKGGVIPYIKSMVPPGLPGWVIPLMFVLELATYFVIRPVTLALRLFGNMFAGHLLLLVFIVGGEYLLLHGGNIGLGAAGIASGLFSIVMTFFELLVEFLQAFVFTILAALYLADAVSEEH